MSQADDLLFSPIDGSACEPWRASCRHVVEEIRSQLKKLYPARPEGAMLLEDMMERFHKHGQGIFWAVDEFDGMFEFDFDGTVMVSNGGADFGPNGDPIYEWNLYPHPTMKTYTFFDEKSAEKYRQSLEDAG